MNEVYVLSPWNLIGRENEKECRTSKKRIFNSFGVGINTFLPAHVDEDAFFSITSTLCCNEICVEGQNEKKKHTNECPISNYFTFPSTGHAVGLRPGDILMFNSMCTHCMSTKTDEYNGIDVANISLFTKMQNIYKHDNDIELTEEEKWLKQE